jgi:hypothetical protein
VSGKRDKKRERERERERDGGRDKQTRDMISQEQNSKRKTKVEGRKARTDDARSWGFDPGTAPTLTSPTQVPCVCFRSRHFQDLVGCVRLLALLDSACEKLEREREGDYGGAIVVFSFCSHILSSLGGSLV